MIKLVSQNFYKELSTSPVNWALGNVGDKIRVETVFSVQIEVITSKDDPFIINNNNGYILNGWLTDAAGRFTDFKIGDAVYYFNYVAGLPVDSGTFYIIDKLSNNEIRLNSAADGSGVAPTSPANTEDYEGVLSNKTPITSVKYHYNFVENAGINSFLSPIDGNEQMYVIENKAASSTGAVSMKPNGPLTWQSGSITIQGVSIVTSPSYVSTYKIIHYTKITPFLLYNQIADLKANIPPVDFEKTKCWKFISQIEAAEVYTNPNFLVSEVFDQELGNVGWYNENFNTGKTNYSISNLVYKNAGKKIDSIQFDTSETTITFNINNTADTPFSNTNTKFVLGFFKAPADPSEYQNNNTLLDRNFLFDRALQTVGVASVNGDNYGGAYQVIKSITGVFVSSSVISITCKIDMAAAVLAGFEASSLPMYFLYVATQNYNYDTENPLNDSVTLPVDLNTFTIISIDPTMIVPSNVFLRHPEADPATEGVEVGFQNSSIGTVAVQLAPSAVSYNYIDRKAYVCNVSTGSVSVINADTNTVIATITGFSQPFGIAFDPVNNRMYVCNSGSGTVPVIDCVTDTIIATISGIGTTPGSLVYNSIDKTIYILANGSAHVKVINCATNTVTATITIPGSPGQIAYNSLANLIYVSSAIAFNISVVDCSSNTIISTITLVSGDLPSFMTFCSTQNTLFVHCYGINSLKVIDCATNSVIQTIASAGGFYSTYNSFDNQIICSDPTHSQVVVIDCVYFNIVATIELTTTVHGIAFDAKNNKLFVANFTGSSVWVLQSSFDVFPEDEIVACSNFYIESAGRTLDTIKLTSVNSKIIASDGTNEFELDEFNMSLNSEPLIGYTQQFDNKIERPFHIPIGTIRKYIEIKRRTDLDTGTRKYFSSNYPFLWRWEYWTQAFGVDSSFFDASLPNNGFNHWWFHYKTGNWNLFYKLIINATKNGIPQQYTLLNRITPNDYNSNSDWTTKTIVTQDPDTFISLITGGKTYIQNFKDTLVIATFTKSTTPVNYWVVIGMEVFEKGGISGKRRYSSRWVGDSDTWFKSIDTSNKVITTIASNTVTAKVLIDYTKLPKNIVSYKLSARIYEMAVGLETDDGVPIETDDGLQIEID